MSNKKLQTLFVLLAWESGDLSEGQAAKALGIDRLELRERRINAIHTGRLIFENNKTPKHHDN